MIVAMSRSLPRFLPALATSLPIEPIAELPTPLERVTADYDGRRLDLLLKRDDVSAAAYGGNKVRKLEFLLADARGAGADTLATFGTVASNHALATALYARRAGLRCICFLSHQRRTRLADVALRQHVALGTEIVVYAGDTDSRRRIVDTTLANRNVAVIPAGGSSWLGTLGYVSAGLELHEQLAARQLPEPARIYIANGTMGSVAGLALGLALARRECRIAAIRVTPAFIANPAGLDALVAGTVTAMRERDPAVPADLAKRVRIDFRDEFFGSGYAHSNPATEAAIEFARSKLGLQLEATYTGKAMAALLADSGADARGATLLFWNTFNSRPLSPPEIDARDLPREFRNYLATD